MDRRAPDTANAPPAPETGPVLGLRQNLGQFSLLVLVNAFVGGMVGLERAILPPIAERGFGFVKAITGRKWMIAGGMWVQAGGIGLIAGTRSFTHWLAVAFRMSETLARGKTQGGSG